MAERSAATCTPSRPARCARQRSDAVPHLLALAELDQHVQVAAGLEPQLALGVLALEQLRVVAEDDRVDAHARRSRRATVAPRSSEAANSPGSSTWSKNLVALERAEVRARLPHRAPAPDAVRVARRPASRRGAPGRDGRRRRRGPRVGLAQRRAQPAAKAARPAPVAPGAGGRIRRDELDREALLGDHRRRAGEGEEERLERSSRRRAIAIDRVRWPRPVPFEERKRMRPEPGPADRR